MTHWYIDEWGIADRYVKKTLPPEHFAEFKAHLANCEECTDRVLLAEMFNRRNGLQRKVEVKMTTAQILWVVVAAALLLLVALMILFIIV